MKSLKQYVAEGRPSQRHPLEGHEYHKKTDAELTYIAKDAHKAAEAMKGHNTAAENKYRDQANDSATVRYFRQKNGMPDWYKKKYGHVKEEVEQIDEVKLVGIMRHPEQGKVYIWHKGGDGGYNYEVEHAKTKKKETHNKSHEDVVAHLKKQGYKMNEEVDKKFDYDAWVKSGKKIKVKPHSVKLKDGSKMLTGRYSVTKKKMNEEVDESYTGKGNHRPGWMLRADPKLGKKLKDAKKGHNALVKYAGKPIEKKANEEVEQVDEVAAWQRKEGKSESGGLNQKGVDSYRRENPGSKLSTAVTTKPSKLKAGSKAANRRKSFCARMGGMKKRLTSAKTARDPDSRINKALRKWNCN
jgi:hypothetical protein